MKIIIHSLDELLALSALIRPAETPIILHDPVKDAQGAALLQEALRKEQGKTLAGLIDDGVLIARGPISLEEPDGLPTDIVQPEIMFDAEVEANIATHSRDADGVPHNTDWHSEPAKLTAKGLWRARRGRDEDAYKAWLLEQAVEVAEAAIAADEAEPVATETHALPQDKCWDEGCVHNEVSHQCVVPQEPGSEPSAAPATPASAVDLDALIAASLEAAQDASDSHVDLLNACRDFTSKHGHPAFTALKAAVAPEDAGGGGKAVQHFTPGERRLMQACIANYPPA